jgi:hypothetical protein
MDENVSVGHGTPRPLDLRAHASVAAHGMN